MLYKLTDRRIDIVKEWLKNPNVHILLANNTDHGFDDTVAIGCIKVKPEDNSAWLFSFYSNPKERGGNPAYEILKRARAIIDKYENEAGEKVQSINLGRYDLTESKQPLLTRITKMVNHAKPDTIKTEGFSWRGSPGNFYYIPRHTFDELFDELGPKFERFLQ